MNMHAHTYPTHIQAWSCVHNIPSTNNTVSMKCIKAKPNVMKYACNLNYLAMCGQWLFHWRTKLQRWCQKDVGILRRGPWALGELEDGSKLPELECRRTRPWLLEPHVLRTSSVSPLPPAVLSPGSSSLSKGMWNHIFPLSSDPTVSFPSSIINAVTVEEWAVADVCGLWSGSVYPNWH